MEDAQLTELTGELMFIWGPAGFTSLLLACLGLGSGYLRRTLIAAGWFVLLGFLIGGIVGFECCEGLEGNYFILYRHPSHLVAYYFFLMGLVAVWFARKLRACRSSESRC